MKKTSVKKYGKPEEKKGPGTFYSNLEGKGKGSRQSHPTHDDLLAKARAAQFVGDMNTNQPFQMPTKREPVRYSVSLPPHFRDELNPVLFSMAPFWGDMLETFGVMFETSTDLWDWLGRNKVSKEPTIYDFACESNRKYDAKIEAAKKRTQDAKVIKALEFEKLNACGAIVVSALRRVLSDVSAVKDSNGLLLDLTPVHFSARKCRLDVVRDFSLQAKRLNWEIQKQKRQAEYQPTEKRGKNQRVKNHKPSRGNDRMVAVREAIVALASGYGAD